MEEPLCHVCMCVYMCVCVYMHVSVCVERQYSEGAATHCNISLTIP